MKKNFLIFAVIFTVAFCSLVYELILGQALSAFLGNTILRYSVTIGLYLFAMGFGAMFAEGRWVKNPIKSFLVIELFLVLFGGFSIVMLFVFEIVITTGLLFFLLAHFLIIVIGILTGFEIPFLIALGKKYFNLKEYTVLGVDYLGAFLGSFIFSFVFYSNLGLFAAAFITALLNSAAGMAVYLYSRAMNTDESKNKINDYLFGCLLFFAAAMLICIAFSGRINDFFVEQFIA